LISLAFLAFAALVPSLPALAEGPADASCPAPGTVRWELGASERVRSESLNNAFDRNGATDDHRLWYPFLTRLSGKAAWGDALALSVGLASENRLTVIPDTPFLWDETVFESLYAVVRLREGLTIRAGRQNLMRGEGFVLFDGAAGDGSRTTYFNAVDVIYAWKGSNHAGRDRAAPPRPAPPEDGRPLPGLGRMQNFSYHIMI